MKTIKLLSSIVILSSLLVLNSCKEEEKKTTPAKTKTELLTGKNWIMESWTVDPAMNLGGGGFITDIYMTRGQCGNDGFRKFNTTGNYVDDEGLSKCSNGDPQTVLGTWEWANNETQLLLDKATANKITATIVKLTETRLEVTYTQIIGTTNHTHSMAFNGN